MGISSLLFRAPGIVYLRAQGRTNSNQERVISARQETCPSLITARERGRVPIISTAYFHNITRMISRPVVLLSGVPNKR